MEISDFHFWNVWIGFSSLVLVDVFEETGTLVVFHVDTVYLQWLIVHHSFLLGLGKEFCSSSVLYLLVQLLLHLLFLSLSCDSLVLQSFGLVVHLFLRLKLVFFIFLDLLLTVPESQGHFFFNNDSLGLSFSGSVFGGFGDEAEVGEGVEVVVELLERVHDFGFEFVVFVLSDTEEVFELGLINFTKAHFTFFPADLLQWAKMFSDVTWVDKSSSVIEHVTEDAFLDDLFELGVSLFGNLMGVLDARGELKIVL